jgi:hypothetical protein
MRKNLISLNSPSSSTPSRQLDGGGRPVVEITLFAKEGFNHEECEFHMSEHLLSTCFRESSVWSIS